MMHVIRATLVVQLIGAVSLGGVEAAPQGVQAPAKVTQTKKASKPHAHPLDEGERERIRYRLDRQLGLVRNLIRNRKSDQLDRERQQRDAERIRLFERIPMSDQLPPFQKELGELAAEEGLELVSVSRAKEDRLSFKRAGPLRVHPRELDTMGPPFRFTDEDLVEGVPIQVMVQVPEGGLISPQARIDRWLDRWSGKLIRLVSSVKAHSLDSDLWEVRVKAFRFRSEIKHPRLTVSDPTVYLPEWAQKNTTAFARAEPKLWDLVKEIRRLLPEALPGLALREEFLLAQARMAFLLSHAENH